MLFIAGKITKQNTSAAARLQVLTKLEERGFMPVIRSMRRQAFAIALAGAEENAGGIEQLLAAATERQGDTAYTCGDLFCLQDAVLFLLFGEVEAGVARAGIIYEGDAASSHETLEEFCRNVRDAFDAATSQSGRRDETEWQEEARTSQFFTRFIAHMQADSAAATMQSTATSVESERGLELLQEPEARRLLHRLVEAQSENRAGELLTGGADEAATETLIRRLSGAQLLRQEVLVSCRREGRSLFRLPTRDALAVLTASDATCSECGANVADEKIEELIKPTDLARTLLEENSWLINSLRSTLDELGVRAEDFAVRERATNGVREAMVEVCGESFLIMLKDGEWTTAHARQALDRVIETEAKHLVIVSTGKIGDEARARLREFARRRQGAGDEAEVILVEGAEGMAAELRHAFDRASHKAIADELFVLDTNAGFSVGEVVAARFRIAHKHTAQNNVTESAFGATAGRLHES
ncbi:MAG: hypothetical protein H0V88_10935 [Pyrinomonadaceae bacterium]|nr:hypothetical protein [Pyrinomonadaceae bacterium]